MIRRPPSSPLFPSTPLFRSGATAGEAVVWYGGQFYALFFLTQTIKVPAVPAQIMIVIALAIATPGFILFGWLSDRSEEHTSELQSRSDLVCRLLLEKKKK